ncbi:ATP cone domain-containing protein, partial [Absicoccus porci]
MNVIKRSGEEVLFNVQKIFNAISKANQATLHTPMTDADIQDIADSVTAKCQALKRSANVEEIQDMVEAELMQKQFFSVA